MNSPGLITSLLCLGVLQPSPRPRTSLLCFLGYTMGITSDSQGHGEAHLRQCMRGALPAQRLAQRKHSLHCSAGLLPSTHFLLFLISRASFQGCFMNMQINATGVLIFSIFTQKFTCPTLGVSTLFPIKGQIVNMSGFEQHMVPATPRPRRRRGKAVLDNECGWVPINFIYGNLNLIFILLSHVMKYYSSFDFFQPFKNVKSDCYFTVCTKTVRGPDLGCFFTFRYILENFRYGCKGAASFCFEGV